MSATNVKPLITGIAFVRGTDADERSGLLGYVTCIVGELMLVDGITVRRTATGRIALSFPERRDRSGRRHPILRPINDLARQQIEREILGRLASNEEIAP